MDSPDRGYFDTSALMRWVESDAEPVRPINAQIGPAVERIIASGRPLAISELTLLEFRAAVARDWRMADPQSAAFDAAWANAARQKVMHAVAESQILVVDVPARAAEHAMTLVDMAAQDHNLALGTWDAIHLITAAAWAQENGSRVHLYASDDDYEVFVDHYPHFKTFVEVVNLEKETSGTP